MAVEKFASQTNQNLPNSPASRPSRRTGFFRKALMITAFVFAFSAAVPSFVNVAFPQNGPKPLVENTNSGKQNQVKKPKVVLAENTTADKLIVQTQMARIQDDKSSQKMKTTIWSALGLESPWDEIVGFVVCFSLPFLVGIGLSKLFGGESPPPRYSGLSPHHGVDSPFGESPHC